MPYYEVQYKLYGSIRVEAESAQHAIRRVRGSAQVEECVPDKDLILGIKGYNPDSDYLSIDYNAIEVVEVVQVEEVEEKMKLNFTFTDGVMTIEAFKEWVEALEEEGVEELIVNGAITIKK